MEIRCVLTEAPQFVPARRRMSDTPDVTLPATSPRCCLKFRSKSRHTTRSFLKLQSGVIDKHVQFPFSVSVSKDEAMERTTRAPGHQCDINISPDEHLPAGEENPWTTWKALNRLRTQVDRSRVNMLKCGFSNEQETCDCGIRQTMQHLLACPHDGHCLLSQRPGNG